MRSDPTQGLHHLVALVHHGLERGDLVIGEVFEFSQHAGECGYRLGFAHLMGDTELSVFRLPKWKIIGPHRSPAHFDGGVGRCLPADVAGSEHVQVHETLFRQFPGFYQFLGIVLQVAEGGGRHIGNIVHGHHHGHIFRAGFFPPAAFTHLRGTGVSPQGRTATALYTGVHVAFVIVADVDQLLVAFRRPAQRLESNVHGTAVAGITHHRRLLAGLLVGASESGGAGGNAGHGAGIMPVAVPGTAVGAVQHRRRAGWRTDKDGILAQDLGNKTQVMFQAAAGTQGHTRGKLVLVLVVACDPWQLFYFWRFYFSRLDHDYSPSATHVTSRYAWPCDALWMSSTMRSMLGLVMSILASPSIKLSMGTMPMPGVRALTS